MQGFIKAEFCIKHVRVWQVLLSRVNWYKTTSESWTHEFANFTLHDASHDLVKNYIQIWLLWVEVLFTAERLVFKDVHLFILNMSVQYICWLFFCPHQWKPSRNGRLCSEAPCELWYAYYANELLINIVSHNAMRLTWPSDSSRMKKQET